jgi:nitrogenase molybdenum-iron protein alpha/beta subunit
MTAVRASCKSYSGRPLKLSPALGGALAFLGIDRCLPLIHGTQGCTAFPLVLAVRHFREAIPLQTTAIDELSAILGGVGNLEQAIRNINERAKPQLIGICSTALTETRDDDIAGDLGMAREVHPEWADLALVYASTPDFLGGLQEGWARAVEAIIRELVPPGSEPKRLR